MPTAANALAHLRTIVSAGIFASFFSIDRETGDVLSSDKETQAWLNALPMLSPSTPLAELVNMGLISALPKGLSLALKAPRYRPGREVFVYTTISHAYRYPSRPVGIYDSSAPLAFTHQAKLVAQEADEFLVEIAGTTTLQRFKKTDIWLWNEPTKLTADGGTFSGVHIDFREPFLRAQIAAAMMSLGMDIATLDLETEEGLALQERLVARLASRVRLSFIGRDQRYSGPRAGALLYQGQGVSFVQRAAALALLAPFSTLLAFDLQVAVGQTLSTRAPHAFLIATLRPTMQRYVIDPTWQEPLTRVRVAFFGPQPGHDRCLLSFEGNASTKVPEEAVSF